MQRLIIDLEALALDERDEFNKSALIEAEQDRDADALRRLMAERQVINEQRRSIQRRRDQTRLLARAAARA